MLLLRKLSSTKFWMKRDPSRISIDAMELLSARNCRISEYVGFKLSAVKFQIWNDCNLINDSSWKVAWKVNDRTGVLPGYCWRWGWWCEAEGGVATLSSSNLSSPLWRRWLESLRPSCRSWCVHSGKSRWGKWGTARPDYSEPPPEHKKHGTLRYNCLHPGLLGLGNVVYTAVSRVAYVLQREGSIRRSFLVIFRGKETMDANFYIS